jgi:hypothetical protein
LRPRSARSSAAEITARLHRDLKPANLFVTALGTEYDVLKVLDFGVVKGTRGETTPTGARTCTRWAAWRSGC